MSLRELLDLCQDERCGEWVDLGGRPATAMVAGIFDPGMTQAATRTLEGHSLAVFEPDPRLALAWPVPEMPEAERPDRFGSSLPEWAEVDTHDWKGHGGYAVVLYSGAPVWQTFLQYLDWGAGIGGYVASFEPVYGDDPLDRDLPVERWTTTCWEIGLARLINDFSPTAGWNSHDPTERIVPEPRREHPLDVARRG